MQVDQCILSTDSNPSLISQSFLNHPWLASVDAPPILVTTDKTMRIKAHKLGMQSEPYFRANPFYRNESQRHTGFVAEGEDIVANSFQPPAQGLERHSPHGIPKSGPGVAALPGY